MRHRGSAENPFLLSYSDLMAALLLVFILLLAVTTLHLRKQAEAQQDKAARITVIKDEIIRQLKKAFNDRGYDIEIDPQTGAIRLASDLLFDVGESSLTKEGQEYLHKILPVYFNVLFDPQFKNEVTQIIIEGHTDPQPVRVDGEYQYAHAFGYNLELSQRRAFSVASFVLKKNYDSERAGHELPNLRGFESELKARLTANGRSFAQPVDSTGHVILPVPFDLIASGKLGATNHGIDFTRCRRVELKFRLNDEKYLQEIREILAQ